jgi:hypothetical protein
MAKVSEYLLLNLIENLVSRRLLRRLKQYIWNIFLVLGMREISKNAVKDMGIFKKLTFCGQKRKLFLLLNSHHGRVR